METQNLLTIDQVAEYLQISRSQVYIFMRQKNNPLPFRQISKKIKRFVREDIDSWLQENERKI